MRIVVLTDAALKEELMKNGIATEAQVIWAEHLDELEQHHDAEAFIDLLFERNDTHITHLKSLLPKTIIINSVIHTLKETDTSFIRFNGWPTLLSSPILEASCSDTMLKKKGEEIISVFGKTMEWLPDEAGFVTPRVISMIVNEAFFALQQGISTPEEIDTAMKLGTAYPYGPFEWSQLIGLKNINTLLHKLSIEEQRYMPCELLVQKADKGI